MVAGLAFTMRYARTVAEKYVLFKQAAPESAALPVFDDSDTDDAALSGANLIPSPQARPLSRASSFQKSRHD